MDYMSISSSTCRLSARLPSAAFVAATARMVRGETDTTHRWGA